MTAPVYVDDLLPDVPEKHPVLVYQGHAFVFRRMHARLTPKLVPGEENLWVYGSELAAFWAEYVPPVRGSHPGVARIRALIPPPPGVVARQAWIELAGAEGLALDNACRIVYLDPLERLPIALAAANVRVEQMLGLEPWRFA